MESDHLLDSHRRPSTILSSGVQVLQIGNGVQDHLHDFVTLQIAWSKKALCALCSLARVWKGRQVGGLAGSLLLCKKVLIMSELIEQRRNPMVMSDGHP